MINGLRCYFILNDTSVPGYCFRRGAIHGARFPTPWVRCQNPIPT
jgi:hypothetical protein